MGEKILNVKNKIINQIMIGGKKTVSEKILFKSLKELNKFSKKQIKKILQMRIFLSIPAFKLHKSINKKKRNKKIFETPAFIPNNQSRNSLSIKFILISAQTRVINHFHNKLKKEILVFLEQKEAVDELKNNLQKKVLAKKSYFRFYRWT
jgi:ribosomal protein S7